MLDVPREIKATKEQFPTHDEIKKRAYELYLKHGDQPGHDIEDWLTAEQQLQQELTTAGGGVDTSLPESDWLVAEEERRSVRAAEQTKEDSVLPRTKAINVGQQRAK